MWIRENNLAIASILLEVHFPKAEAAQESIALGTSEADRKTLLSYDESKD